MNATIEMLIGSKLRAKLLGWLFSYPGERFYGRQLTTILNDDSTNVSRELARLEMSGILVSTVEGKRKYYSINRGSPAFSELKELFTNLTAENMFAEEHAVSNAGKIQERLLMFKSKVSEICRLNHIKRLSLYGSVLRDNFRPDSDIDILAEFEPGRTPGFLKLFEIETHLSSILGRKVDLRTPEDLSLYFRDKVLKEAEIVCQ
jgi:predicted nucleotidyltransferase